MTMINPMIQTVLIVEIGHMTERGYIIETGTTLENTKETGHTIKIDCMTEIIHIAETGHSMDKYECQFRNDNYDIIRGRPKEKPCSCNDQSYDSFYSGLEKWYSSTVGIDCRIYTICLLIL